MASSKKHGKDTNMGVCDYHLCRKQAKVFKCKFCGNSYCENHIKPKMVTNLSQISSEKEPLRSWLEEEYRKEDAHPDSIYTQLHWDELKAKRKEEIENRWKSIDESKGAFSAPMIERRHEIPEKRIPYSLPEKIEPLKTLNKLGSSLRIPEIKRPSNIKMPKGNLAKLSTSFLFILIAEAFLAKDYVFKTFYLFEVILTGWLLYKMFVKTNNISVHSDLRLFGIKILSGLTMLGGSFLLIFLIGPLFLVMMFPNNFSKFAPIDTSILIFVGLFGFGLVMLAAFLFFRFMRGSGLIIYRGN